MVRFDHKNDPKKVTVKDRCKQEDQKTSSKVDERGPGNNLIKKVAIR